MLHVSYRLSHPIVAAGDVWGDVLFPDGRAPQGPDDLLRLRLRIAAEALRGHPVAPASGDIAVVIIAWNVVGAG